MFRLQKRYKVMKIFGKGMLLTIITILIVACGVNEQSSNGQQNSQMASTESIQLATVLRELSADEMVPIDSSNEYVDPTYQTLVRKITDVTDGQGRMRHEYSRRQAFNADNTKMLAQDGAGYWFLYDTNTAKLIGKVAELAGDSEPIWHSNDPNKLYFTQRGGGQTWWSLDIATNEKKVVYDFSNDSEWPQATSYWTKGEGTTSADGRYLTLMASAYHEDTQTTTVYGIVMLDLVEGKIVGRLPASDFPVAGAVPDHVSTAPSGKYAVVSWLAGEGGTVAYTPDFRTSIPLAEGSEHSDLAIGLQGQDVLVYADYTTGYIQAIDVATGESQNLHSLYPAEGEGYALHISGQAFDKPGWVVVSTYADFADYGETYPASELRAEYRKVWLMELKPDGQRLNVAHIYSDNATVSSDEAYFLEPQASVSRDLSHIVFASNLSGAIESYVIELPENIVK